MVDGNQFELPQHDQATDNLTQVLVAKIEYLKSLEDAVKRQDDRLVYELIDTERYDKEVVQARHGRKNQGYDHLITDSYAFLNEYLSTKLIAYLREEYPFFYFEKTDLGQFQFYFGNWWGRRLFGQLDVLHLALNFDQEELAKLKESFELKAQGQRYNSTRIHELASENDRLQALIDGQDERDAQKSEIRQKIKELAQEKTSFWRSGEQKDEKQKLQAQLSDLSDLDQEANEAYQKIRDNEKVVLELSKEDTLLGYERESIVTKFGSFEAFQKQVASLYHDYLTKLVTQKG